MSVVQKISDAIKDMPAIGKDEFNPQQKFKYRSIDQIMNKISPVLSSHGLVISPEVLDHEYRPIRGGKSEATGRLFEIRFHVYSADDDGKVTFGPFISEAIDYGDKAASKAHTMAFKTFLSEVFMLPFANDTDGDKDSPTKEPVRPPITKGNREHLAKVFKLLSDENPKLTRAEFADYAFETLGHWPETEKDEEALVNNYGGK